MTDVKADDAGAIEIPTNDILAVSGVTEQGTQTPDLDTARMESTKGESAVLRFKEAIDIPAVPIPNNLSKGKGSRKRPALQLEEPVPMQNAYYICHDVSDFLLYRGLKWHPGPSKGKSKAK